MINHKAVEVLWEC